MYTWHFRLDLRVKYFDLDFSFGRVSMLQLSFSGFSVLLQSQNKNADAEQHNLDFRWRLANSLNRFSIYLVIFQLK